MNWRIGGVSTVGSRTEPSRATASQSRVTALSSCTNEPWPGPAAGGQPHPGQALLGGLHEVEAQVVADGDAEAADLADRLGAVLEQVGVLVDEPAGAELAAGLLVGDVGQHDVARRLHAGAGPVAHQRQDHGVHVLHVDRAPAPDVAVALLAGERVDAPLGRVGGDDVQVPVHQQGGPAAVGALDAGDQAGPARLGLADLGLDADVGELAGDPLGGGPLPRAGRGVAGVRRVDPDQVGQQLGDLGLGGGEGRQRSARPCADRATRRRSPRSR